jgi:hypothetical protein
MMDACLNSKLNKKKVDKRGINFVVLVTGLLKNKKRITKISTPNHYEKRETTDSSSF